MKIGVYGGTFNPPHLGHLAAARAAVERLELDKLLAMRPDNDPAAYGAAQGRIAYLEYYLEEVRACKLMSKHNPGTPPRST